MEKKMKAKTTGNAAPGGAGSGSIVSLKKKSGPGSGDGFKPGGSGGGILLKKRAK
jgi:hypothetical protein